MATTTESHDLDGFLDLPEIARLESRVTTRTIRNRIAAGTFPPSDGVINGAPVWLRSTYAKYQKAVLAGEYRGRDRIENLRGRGAAA